MNIWRSNLGEITNFNDEYKIVNYGIVVIQDYFFFYEYYKFYWTYSYQFRIN